ncbi:MAG: methyltransferase domain-containing protein [Eubacteriales bacterium]
MKKNDYYSSGTFAKMAGVTLRTIRYYDKQNILKPSFVTEAGARFYSDQDFSRLQQILLLKFLGFSLEDIKELTFSGADSNYLANSLHIQQKLIQDRIEHMQLVQQAIEDTALAIEEHQEIDWNHSLNLLQLTRMETSLKRQYLDASNISARINLHKLYANNPQGWYPWIYQQCNIMPEMKILELGCGDGSFWTNNKTNLPSNVHITISDISQGMLNDARRNIGSTDARFQFHLVDATSIPYEDKSYDLVIANHVLFYCDDLNKACSEIHRVLKPGGIFISSTYGQNHMKEINQLVRSFDNRILLSGDKLYERFGKENGSTILASYFNHYHWISYEDSLNVSDSEALISYVLSCHGNQNQYILENYKEFRTYVSKKTEKNFHITKDAGVFISQK